MAKDKDEDNVEYLERKPGFYKKGPMNFKIHFGTLDEIEAKADEAKKPRLVPDPPDESA